MKIIKSFFGGAHILTAEPMRDPRGGFTRLYCEKEFQAIGHTQPIVQINHSFTKRTGVIRGLHFQHPPKSEIKMLRCINGSVFDVIVDLRAGSPTFLQWHGQVLTKDDDLMVYVPQGFAHGYQTLEDNSELIYFHSDFYSHDHEGGIKYDEPLVNIKWPLEISEVSEKDKNRSHLPTNFKGIIL